MKKSIVAQKKSLKVKNSKADLGGILDPKTMIEVEKNISDESEKQGKTETLVVDNKKEIVVPQQLIDLSTKLTESGKKLCESNIEAAKSYQEKMIVVQKEMLDLTTVVQTKENVFLLMENELLKEKAKLDAKKAEYTNLQFQMLLENKKNETIMAQVNGYNKGLTEGVIITNKYDLTKVTNLKKGATLVFDYLQAED